VSITGHKTKEMSKLKICYFKKGIGIKKLIKQDEDTYCTYYI